MELSKAKEDLRIYKTCVGNERKFLTTHRNEVRNGNFASINRNIQINIAKLNDAITEEEKNSESNQHLNQLS